MNKCLQCQKEYKAKRPSSKFCSDNCRVKYHRSHKDENKTPKAEVGKIELEVLYNKILDLVDKFERPIGDSFDGKKTNTYNIDEAGQYKESEKDSNAFKEEILASDTVEQISSIMEEVEQAVLTFYEKKALKDLAKKHSLTFYND